MAKRKKNAIDMLTNTSISLTKTGVVLPVGAAIAGRAASMPGVPASVGVGLGQSFGTVSSFIPIATTATVGFGVIKTLPKYKKRKK